MRPSQYYKKSINFPWTKWIVKKNNNKNTHKYSSVATAYVQNLKAHQDLNVFLQLYGVVSLALHCNEISNGTVLIYSGT